MDSIAEIVKTLIWAIVIVSLVIYLQRKFRNELATLLARLLRIKGKGFEAEFANTVSEAEADLGPEPEEQADEASEETEQTEETPEEESSEESESNK